MTVSSKVRIYDLAKELKLDTKRLIEEVQSRRCRCECALKLRIQRVGGEDSELSTFRKKRQPVKRAVKVVKRAAMPADGTRTSARRA
jgi:hypothetical protein